MDKIPIYKPWLTDVEKKYVAEAMDSTWISSQGKFVNLFEEKFAEFVGTKYAVSTCNGTMACHLALLGAGVRAGDRVAVPDLTYVATANAVAFCGATVCPFDVNIKTWNMEITPNVALHSDHIFAVQLLGNPVKKNVEIIASIIEDSCEAIGCYDADGKHAGSHISKCAAFSFFGNKTITTGEGGMVVTNDTTTYNKLKHLRGHYHTGNYWHPKVGYNYRMTNVAAAVGCGQLQRIDLILYEKARVYNRYVNNLANQRHISLQQCRHGEHGQWMFGIQVRNPKMLARILQSYGIDTRPMFHPISSLPMYKNCDVININAAFLHQHVLLLPSYPQLTNKQVDYICEVVKKHA